MNNQNTKEECKCGERAEEKSTEFINSTWSGIHYEDCSEIRAEGEETKEILEDLDRIYNLEPNWQIELDKLCTGKSRDTTWAFNNSEIKDFIKSLLSSQRTELIGEIEKMRMPFKVSENMELRDSYNQALSDIIKIIKGKN